MRINGEEVWVSRTDVQSIGCPACTAEAGEQCVGAREKPRESNHMERIEAFIATRSGGFGECPRQDDPRFAAFAAEHFPGVDPKLVAHGAGMCRNVIPATPENIRPFVDRWTALHTPEEVAS